MDRRKIKSRSVLHKPLISSSQTVAKTVADSLSTNISRSISAVGTLSTSRKRKNSEEEENEIAPLASSTMNLKKKRRSTVLDNDDDDEDGASSPKQKPGNGKDCDDKFVKPKASQLPRAARQSNRSDDDEENESNNGGSYIRGVLQALDKSPAKLSQSSNSSVDRFRHVNLRTPIRSRIQKSAIKAVPDKKSDRIKDSQSAAQSVRDPRKKNDRVTACQNSSREKNQSNNSNDSDDSEIDAKRKTNKNDSVRHNNDSDDSEIGAKRKSKKNNSVRHNDSDDSEISAKRKLKKNDSVRHNDSDDSEIGAKRKSKKNNSVRHNDSDDSEISAKRKLKKNDSVRHNDSDDSEIGAKKKLKKNNSVRHHLTSSKKKVRRPYDSDDSDDSKSENERSNSETDSSPERNKNKKTNKISPEKKTNSLKAKNSPLKERTLVKNFRNRVPDSPELSPLKDFQSPEKINVGTRRTKNQNQGDDPLTKFLNSAGITLYPGDELHIANDDPREVIQKMKELITLNGIDTDDIIKSWNEYIKDEENLKKSLLEMKIETDEGVAVCSKAVSLSRILLQVSQLQVDILNSLFQKLIDAVIATESSDEAPWALQLLQQFRFLEMLVDTEVLITRIEELLSSSPEWFQREIIVFIPDIVTDIQHRTTAEMLIKIMEKNSDLTNIILDCIHNLILGKDYREELRDKILGLLETKIDKSTIPAITRFVLNSCSSEAVALKSLKALRIINMAPTAKENVEECYTYQMFMVNALKISIQLFNKEVIQASVALIKNVMSEVAPLDIIISILIYETTNKKKIVEAAFFSHIKDGYYKTSILKTLYTGYRQVVKSFQSTALNIAISLLKAESPAHTEFGIEWIRNIFISQSDAAFKQREIMEKLLNLMGSKDKTVKNVLEVLCRMANDETERQYLQQHAGFLRCFLEKIDNLQFDEVTKLYHLLHGLCTHSETISNILNDDLSIIMQKQLCSTKVLTKCKGVLGSVMAIKHLAGDGNTSEQAYQLLKKTLSSLKDCIKSQALFYDQLGQVIVSNDNNIDEDFLQNITVYFEDIFANACLVDNNDTNLTPKFGLNDPSMAENYYVNFKSGKTGAFVPVFFKLLCVCNLRLSGNLESINAVLGCSILMPDDLDMPEPSTADYIIHCINWFRELISGFVTQEENLLREQVLKRLESLMTLQGEFVTMVAMCESKYQPPLCYFHYFPAPQFVRVDMKVGKKGAKKGKKKEKDEKDDKNESTLSKSVILPEWESWELGSELTIKNPAFFRKMDTKIINLLDVNMDIHPTAQGSGKITIPQVCFITKELLGMFENQVSEHFVRDLIQLLPKICAKLQKIIADLRENDSAHEKEAVRLLLSLLYTIFSWKEFKTARYNTLLRDGLRTLAGMLNESSALLRSCKDLVAEAYKYFESLGDIATQISLAVALVNMCNCLMKHSNSFSEQSKDRQAKMAYGFLCLEWNNDTNGPQYRAAVKELLKMWIDNESDPLKTISSVLEWLPDEALSLDRPQSRLRRLPSVSKTNFHLLLKQLFSGLINGIRVSLEEAERDPERIQAWLDAASCLDKMANICKSSKNTIYLMLFLRYTTTLYQMLLTSGMKLLEVNVKYQTDDILNVIKLFQKSGRFLRDIFVTARKEKNVSLLKLIPLAKSRREKFIYRVKGMLTAHNSLGAFWMGNLLNKDLDGEEVASESSEDLTAGSDLTNDNNEESGSEIFNSDSDVDVEDEAE